MISIPKDKMFYDYVEVVQSGDIKWLTLSRFTLQFLKDITYKRKIKDSDFKEFVRQAFRHLNFSTPTSSIKLGLAKDIINDNKEKLDVFLSFAGLKIEKTGVWYFCTK